MKRARPAAILAATLAATIALAAWPSLGRALRRREADVIAARAHRAGALCRVEDGALRLNINAADAQTLRLLPGFGESLSQAVAAWRAEKGPFASVEALADVPGVGPGRVEAVRDMICCGEGD